MRAMPVMGSMGVRATRLLLLVATLALAACSHHSTNTTVGVGIGVELTSPLGTTLVETGGALVIDATVIGDPKNAGVTWELIGGGSAAASTPNSFTFQAPTGVKGALTVTLTATSISDPTLTSSVSITVNGTPQIIPPLLFPGNYNVPYGTYIIVAGGEAPYTWTLLSGTLPAGLSLTGGTGSTTAVTGTPTALGTSTFTLQVEDALNAKATVTVTIKITPQTACILGGQYAYLFTGFHNGLPVTRAGTMDILSDGTITGEFDYKDSTSARIDAQITDGTCTTTTQNRGTVRLVSGNNNSYVESFDFGTDTALNFGQIQEDDGTSVVGSAQFVLQDKTAFSLDALAGDWAFGLVGASGDEARLALAGRLTLGGNGAVSAGQADANAAFVPPASPLTGQLSAPDASGRGTGILTAGALSLPVAYYVVDANTLYVVSNDTSTTTPRVAGQMTRQAAGPFDGSALAGTGIMSLFGSTESAGQPNAFTTLGWISAGTGSSVQVELDYTNSGTTIVDDPVVATPYTVAANGRGTMTFPKDVNYAARDFVLYLSGPSAGYVLEPASAEGYWGIIEQQTGTPFNTFGPAYFVGGSIFNTSSSPITLTPQILFQGGSLSGNVTGSYATFPDNGRLLGSVGRNILGGTGLVGYLVSPSKVVLMGNGVNALNSTIVWLQSY